MERIFRRGLAAFRWGAFIWLVIVLALYWDTGYLRHQLTALALVAAAGVFTVLQTALLPLAIRFANRRRVALGEMTVAIALMTLDGYVRRSGVVFDNAPTLGSWWPVVALLGAATYLPTWAAVLGGLSFGVADTVSAHLNGADLTALSGSETLSLINTGVFSALAAASVCGLMKLMRNAESEVALARAREEVSRTLHDGVLQTLAIVERKSHDSDLKEMARKQERELRQFLFGQRAEGGEEEIGTALLEAASRFETVFGGRVQVIVAPDVPELPPGKRSALMGAIGEALTNAGKHGGAKNVTVYVEPDDDEMGVFCSVKDDGTGFDLATVSPRVGLARSIRGRIEEAGGRVEIKSSPGAGTEILLWLT